MAGILAGLLPNHLLHVGFLLGRLFYPEDGGDTFFQDVGSNTDYMEIYSRR
jgi:hypothetical protein